MTVIEAQGVSKKYGNAVAVSEVTLRIEAGEIVALLGPNGAGKTTMLDMILGLTAPTAGTVSLYGGTPRQAIADQKIGVMLQTGGLLRDVTVGDTLTMIAALNGMTSRVEGVLQDTGLATLRNRRVGRCSGGEQQRLKFALAILSNPQLLILDEPTTGMDVAARRDFWKRMKREAALGRTIIFATHYLAEAEEFAQRIVLMARGSVVADGSIEQLQGSLTGRVIGASLPPELGPVESYLQENFPEAFCRNAVDRRVELIAPDADRAAARLLADGAFNLVITQPSLDEVFVAFTGGQR